MKKNFYALFILLALMFSNQVNAQESTVIYSASFSEGMNGWTAEGDYANQGMWAYESSEKAINGYGYMATASGCKSYLVSPEVQLEASNNKVTFNHKGFFFTDMAAETALLIRADKGEWVELEGIQYPTAYEVVSSGEITIPAEFNSKNVQFAFYYTILNTANIGNWFIYDFSVSAEKSAAQKKDAGISFDVEEAVYTIGEEESFVAPVLNNPNNLQVYYSSENESVAIVDETGKLEIVGEGSALIRALTLPTEEFEKGEASYILKVVNPNTVFIASFMSDVCGFHEETKSENNAWSYIASASCLMADAYEKVSYATEFYFISPQFTLNADGNALSFDHMTAYFTDIQSQAQVVIREVGGEWIKIENIKYPTDEGVTFSNTGEVTIPAELNGKTVELAFKYTSDGFANSGIWYIKNLLVSKQVPTGIGEVKSEENNSNVIYDLQGRRVNNPAEGLYIVNGKKVIIK